MKKKFELSKGVSLTELKENYKLLNSKIKWNEFKKDEKNLKILQGLSLIEKGRRFTKFGAKEYADYVERRDDFEFNQRFNNPMQNAILDTFNENPSFVVSNSHGAKFFKNFKVEYVKTGKNVKPTIIKILGHKVKKVVDQTIRTEVVEKMNTYSKVKKISDFDTLLLKEFGKMKLSEKEIEKINLKRLMKGEKLLMNYQQFGINLAIEEGVYRTIKAVYKQHENHKNILDYLDYLHDEVIQNTEEKKMLKNFLDKVKDKKSLKHIKGNDRISKLSRGFWLKDNLDKFEDKEKTMKKINRLSKATNFIFDKS